MDLEESRRLAKKNLQAQIQQIKRSVPKGDKKRQKEAKEQIAKLEAEFAQHQNVQSEVNEPESVDTCDQLMAEVSLSGPMEKESGDNQGKKSKAAKRREKKEREEKERAKRIAEAEKESLCGARHIEQTLIDTKLSQRRLRLYDIPSDGDCLYKAISHQLSLKSGEPTLSVTELRAKVAAQMLANKSEYMPFLTSSDGEPLDEEGFVSYCGRLETTHEWGGHVEIKALSALTAHPVLIIQADQDIVIEHEGNASDPLTIVYHKRLYELGEHYNSVISLANAQPAS